MTDGFTILPQGPFSLRAAARFDFGPRAGAEAPDEGVMRLAFCVDGFGELAGVVLRQDGREVQAEVRGARDLQAVRAQVARILSLDHDGQQWQEVGERDPVIAGLQAAHPGLRPVLFNSPYEAAAWSIISARRPRRQAAESLRRLSDELGQTFELAGQRLAAFPLPERLLELETTPGLSAQKVTRLRAVAEAAVAGRLHPERLRAVEPEAAMAELRALPGIGPFYAGLIVARATGLADVLPVSELRSRSCAAHYYGLERPPDQEAFTALAEAWRPFRTWAVVLMRVAGDRAGLGAGQL